MPCTWNSAGKSSSRLEIPSLPLQTGLQAPQPQSAPVPSCSPAAASWVPCPVPVGALPTSHPSRLRSPGAAPVRQHKLLREQTLRVNKEHVPRWLPERRVTSV